MCILRILYACVNIQSTCHHAPVNIPFLFMTYMYTGRIPLRQLVYRVLDLPPSMRPLVYDFGQLDVNTEKDYIRQIVSDRCRDIPLVGADMSLVNAIAHVLAWSQKYIRDRKVSMV